MNTFESFLVDCMGREGFTQVRLVPRIDEHGNVRFYAHPQGINGETFDGEVSGKHVRAVVTDDLPADDEPEEDGQNYEPVDPADDAGD